MNINWLIVQEIAEKEDLDRLVYLIKHQLGYANSVEMLRQVIEKIKQK